MWRGKRNGLRPGLIYVRGRISRSSRLGFFRLGGRRGGDSKSNGSRVDDRGRGPLRGLKDELWPPRLLAIGRGGGGQGEEE